MTPPTPRQVQAIRAIERLTASNGSPPSYRELQAELNVRGAGAIQQLISRMVDRGLITRDPNRARSIRVVDQGDGLESLSSAQLRKLRLRITRILRERAQ